MAIGMKSFGSVLLIGLGAIVASPAFAQSPPADLAETREIQFGSGLDCSLVTAQYNGCALMKKANELGTPVKIYEYVRNTIEYAPYHGSRSNSTNTFLGERGSDVDTASVLIAMLRARSIPARYVTGTIQVEASKVTSWLNVQNTDLAVSILKDQGIQQVALTNSGATIDMEHTWVEALAPYANYRAGGPDLSNVNCSTQRPLCRWVTLAPAFKLREQSTNIDVYPTLDFDYDAYYNAILYADPARMDKNPLEIYEEQILAHLRTTFPGKTLEDVSQAAPIVKESLAVLPNSLPFKVLTANPRTYNSVVEHDQVSPPLGTAEPKRWAKYARITASVQQTDEKGFAVPSSQYVFSANISAGNISIQNGKASIPLAVLTTTRLSVAFRSQCEGCSVTADLLLGTQKISLTQPRPAGTLFYIALEIDGAPGYAAGLTDQVITANYANNVIGGYYLIGTGGDTSNWSQMHRSAAQLLASNEQYAIVKDSNGFPYVDANDNGAIDSGEVELRLHPQAMDALTGGLLFTAMNLYYARFHESIGRLDDLNHTITPLGGFIGIVSSVYDVDYIDGTAFSVMPGGLLIDMKGIQFNGTWRTNAPATYAEKHFLLNGHIGSSLEHEIWQELTGFDAISTVRGIQMALAAGAYKLDITKESLASQYSALGFQAWAPPGFTLREREIYGIGEQTFASWEYSGASPAAFEMFKATVTSSDSDLRATGVTYWSDSNFDAFVNYTKVRENFYLPFDAYNPNASAPDDNFYALPCSPTQYPNPQRGTYSELYDRLLTHFVATLNACFNGDANGITEDGDYAFRNFYAAFVNKNQGFNASQHVYRSVPAPVEQHSSPFVMSLRNQLYTITCKDKANVAIPCSKQFVVPSQPTRGAFYQFTVYIDKRFETSANKLSSLGFLIQNQSYAAGGGWVNGERPREQHEDTTGSVFNNEIFTDQNLNAQANNDLVTTPSTVDPVSTVTGNMYHDETDVVLKGRGLNYSFTRTYNSGPTRTNTGDGPLGPNWTHSYNMRLVANDYGRHPNYPTTPPYAGYSGGLAPENGNGRTSSITYIDERGGEVNYPVDDASQTYAVSLPRGVFNPLVLNAPVTGQYTLTFRNGVKYIFEGGDLKIPGNTARLILISDPYGNQLTLSYDGGGRLQSVADNLGIAGRTGLTFTYELINGKLDTVSDWQGRTWSYDYDDGRLASVENPRQEVTTYTYHDDTALLNQIIRPQDRGGKKVTTTFRYYRNNRAFDYTNSLGQAETLDYDLYRKRTRVTDPRGFIREHYYDEDGGLTRLEEPDGGILLFGSNENGLRCSKTDGLGFQTWYKYARSTTTTDDKTCLPADASGNVTREIDPLGNSISYTYDLSLFDQLTSVTDKRGFNWTQSHYQTTDIPSGAVRGKVHKAFSPLSATVPLIEFTYYANGNVKQQIEYIDINNANRKRVTDFFYDPSGLNLTEKQVSGSGVVVRTTFTYDGYGRRKTETLHRRKSATDGAVLQLTKTFDYDDLDRVVKVTDPLGNIAETIYDANGREIDEKMHYKRPDGSFDVRAHAHHEYDAADRRIRTVDILGHATSYEYDASGNVVAVTDPNNHTVRYEYDAMNRRTAVIAANGYRSELVYDLAGRLVKAVDANGNGSTVEYDALGRSTKARTTLGHESHTEYDPNGNVSKVIDANAVAGVQSKNAYGATVYNEYDAMNRLVLTVDAINGETRYTYDLLGNRLTIKDAEQRTTTMVYDDLGRLIEVHDPIVDTPVDRISTLTYDEAGNVLTATDRKGDVVRHAYDSLNRLTLSEHLTDGTQEVRTYDMYGNMQSVSNQAVTYIYEYDIKNRMKRKTDNRLNKSLDWTYDPAGLIRTKTDYQGEVTTYQYDSANRLVAQVNPGYVQVSYHYDPAGRLVDRILSNGARTHYGYDADNRLTELINYSPTGAVVHSQSYGYDRLRNIEEITDASGLTTYIYDPLYRLTSVLAPGTANDQVYTYDKVGNRKTFEGPAGNKHYYNYNAGNRLVDVRTESFTGEIVHKYSYDYNGSRIEKTNTAGDVLQSYTYDQKRRIIQVATGGVIDTFAYDPADYRIQKVEAAGTKKYLLEAEHLEATYDQSNQLLEKFLRGAVVDEVVYGYRGEGPASVPATYHHDHLQSVVALTGHDGATQQTIKYDPFGRIQSQVGSTSNDLSYTGRERDRDAGLYYYRARYYDPDTGRFLTEDPKGFAAGVNFYSYVNNNPVNANDPMGLEPVGPSGGFALTGYWPIPVWLSYEGALLFDTVTWDLAWVNTAGYGFGSSLFPTGSLDLTLNWNWTDPGADVFDYSGTGFTMGASLNAFGAWGIEGSAGFPLGQESPPWLYSAGLTYGVPGADAHFGWTEGEVHNSTVVRDSGNWLIDLGNGAIDIYNYWFDQSVEPIDYIPATNPLSGDAGAGGGYVLYPGRPNYNMSTAVYEKGG